MTLLQFCGVELFPAHNNKLMVLKFYFQKKTLGAKCKQILTNEFQYYLYVAFPCTY